MIGKILLATIFLQFEIVVNSGRLYWLQKHFISIAFKHFFYAIQHTFFAGLGAAWFFAFWIIFKESYGKIFAIAICFSVLIIAMDHTRVFA